MWDAVVDAPGSARYLTQCSRLKVRKGLVHFVLIQRLQVSRIPKIRLIILFAAKDGEALYCQQKQDRELTVAQTMNSLLPNTDLN